MFRLRVSVTFVSRRMASVLLGPGICVLTTGPSGSPWNKDPLLCALDVEAAFIEAAVAYDLRVAYLRLMRCLKASELSRRIAISY
jgi:hypothetical protein